MEDHQTNDQFENRSGVCKENGEGNRMHIGLAQNCLYAFV
jgi:hypothetical protein